MRKRLEKTKLQSEPVRLGRIRVQTEKRRMTWDIAGLLALFCGAAGLLALAESVFNLLVFERTAVLLWTGIACALVWGTRLVSRRRLLWTLPAVAAAALGIWLWKPLTLLPKIRLLVLLVLNDPWRLLQFDMTEVICLAAVLLVGFLCITAFGFGAGWIAYGLSVPLLVLGAAADRLPPFWAVAMLVLFHGESHLEAAAHKTAAVSGSHRVAARGGILLAAVLCAALFGVQAVLTPHMEVLFALPKRVQDAVFPENTAAEDVGRTSMISSGRYTTGRDVLALTLDTRPEETLYLRNFCGGIYAGGAWSSVDETDFFAGLEEQGIEKARDWAENQAYMRMDQLGAPAQTLRVTRLNNSAAGDYTPYRAALKSTEGHLDIFRYFAPQAGEESMGTTFAGAAQYAEYAALEYTEVPETLEEMKRFVQENPQNGFAETERFILRSLWENTTYTLSPGLVPPGKDPAEYFFFDNRLGYCEHYAATAALLFRLYGYPSRYITGYVASTERFQRQSDGSYQAVLTDHEAHAWVEVFVDGAWILVEATPPGSVVTEAGAARQEEERPDAEPAGTPQATATAAPGPTAEPTAAPETPDTVETPVPTARPTVQTDLSGPHSKNPQKMPDWLPYAGGILGGAAAVGMVAALLCRRRERRRCADARVMLEQSLRVLHRAGLLREMDGTERDFAARLHTAVPEIEIAQAEKLRADALETAFGGTGCRRAESEIYRLCKKAARRKLLRRKRSGAGDGENPSV